MHNPVSEPRPSVFYHYAVHSPFNPSTLKGNDTQKVVIVGAGPIGMTTALNLARFGIPSVVLEQELQVSHGSRALALTRRSYEILEQAGVVERFLSKALPWRSGNSFYRDKQVYRMELPHDDDERFFPVTNLQQQYIEEYLADALEENPLIELRWGCKVASMEQQPNKVRICVDTPFGEYTIATNWLIAADGGRSAIRKALNLRMEGTSYVGNFVIADIKANLPLPTERLCYFDPEWSPGNNALIHRAPDNIWRFDFRLPEGTTPEEALVPAYLHDKIERILDMIGHPVAWELDWATVYSASALTLGEYIHDRVIFVGDAAHVLPIFGVRGANTGFQDCENLAWKLALVVNGIAGRSLLQSYSSERVRAAREICDEAGKTTRFMTPPSPGFRLMRDAVLSLSLSQDFPRDLLHWRTSRPHVYTGSPLNSFPEDDARFDGGVECGQSARNVKLHDGSYLLSHMRTGFHLICFSEGGPEDKELPRLITAARQANVPVVTIRVARSSPQVTGPDDADIVLHDADGRVAQKYAAIPGAAYLLRPDLHVCARWLKADADKFSTALHIASGQAAEVLQ
jgi:3-(3-hydroxy-phenyl)propionate hydroxylase